MGMAGVVIDGMADMATIDKFTVYNWWNSIVLNTHKTPTKNTNKCIRVSLKV